MEVPAFRAGHGVIRLRPDQLVAKLEPTMHLAEHALFHEPSKGLPRGRGRELYYRVERQIRQAATEHPGAIERRARPRIEPSQLTAEHGRAGPRSAEVADRRSVQRLRIAQ